METGVAARASGDRMRERLDERAALIAYHWEAAGERSRAAQWSSRAAEWAGVYRPSEAIRYWRKVRELTADGLSSDDSALALVARLWVLELGWRTGISEVEAAAVYAESRTLAERRDDPSALSMALTAYAHVHGSMGKAHEYARLSQEGVRLADESGRFEARLAGRMALTYALFRVGRLRDALATADEAIELTGGDPAIPILVGSTAGVSSALACFTMFRGLVLAFAGPIDIASTELERAMELAERHGDEEVAAWARSAWGAVAEVTGETDRALAHAVGFLEFAERSRGPFQLVGAYNNLGWVRLVRGELDDAVTLFERSLGLAEEHRTSLELRVETMAHLAEAYAALGQADRARELAEESLSRARSEDRPFDEGAALLSLARVLLRIEGDAAGERVRESLARSLTLARETGARSREPLIHVELAELARLEGDEEGRESELRAAERLFREIGAHARAERVGAVLKELQGGTR